MPERLERTDITIKGHPVFTYRDVCVHETKNAKTGELSSELVLRRDGCKDVNIIVSSMYVPEAIDTTKAAINRILDQSETEN